MTDRGYLRPAIVAKTRRWRKGRRERSKVERETVGCGGGGGGGIVDDFVDVVGALQLKASELAPSVQFSLSWSLKHFDRILYV